MNVASYIITYFIGNGFDRVYCAFTSVRLFEPLKGIYEKHNKYHQMQFRPDFLSPIPRALH